MIVFFSGVFVKEQQELHGRTATMTNPLQRIRKKSDHMIAYMPMKFIFSTGSLYTYSIERCFELAQAAGFDGIELMVDARWDTRQPHLLRRQIERFSLPIDAVHSPFLPAPGWPAEQAEMIHFAVRLAEAVGASVVIHHLPLRLGYATVQSGRRRAFVPLPWWDMEAGYRGWLERELHLLQQSTNVILCIENMPAKTILGKRFGVHHWNACDEQSLHAITRFPALTMDTTHLGTWGLDPSQVYNVWGKRVRHIHLSNFDGREHRLPQHGQLRLDLLISALAADNYQGAISLELHPDALNAGQDDEQIVALLRTSLQECRSWADLSARQQAAMTIVSRE